MVTIVEDQPEWPARFSEAVAELRTVFSGLPVQLEHIGSTSVVGLCAKPILDILLGAPELSAIEERIQALAELGYRYRPEHEAEIPDRRYFVRRVEAPRSTCMASSWTATYGGAISRFVTRCGPTPRSSGNTAISSGGSRWSMGTTGRPTPPRRGLSSCGSLPD